MSKNIEQSLFNELSEIIEQGKQHIASQVNSVLTITYWHIGKRINEHIIKNERAEYGEEIVSQMSKQLVENYSKSFHLKNLYRMMQFADTFPKYEIVVTMSRQLLVSFCSIATT